jgi:hypothetical protein
MIEMLCVYCEVVSKSMNVTQVNFVVQSVMCCYVIIAARSQVDKTEIWRYSESNTLGPAWLSGCYRTVYQ